MLTFAEARAAACTFVAAVLLACTAGAAGAKPKARILVPAPPAVSTAAPSSAPAPVRFFTINQVLAAHEGRSPGDTAKFAAVDPAGTTSDAPSPLTTNRPPLSHEPFGLATFRAPEGLLWVKWRRVEQQIDTEAEILRSCRAEPEDCSSLGAKKFLAIVADAQRREGRARIEVVNRLVNASIRYVSDMAQHGVPDLWSPPLATLTSGLGDCEDYAIAKYVALREAGAAEESLRLLLVRDRAAGQDHAVLAVRQDDRWLVLDNRHLMLNEAAELPHFVPLFSIDHQGVKLFAAPYAKRPTYENTAGLASATPSSDDAAVGSTAFTTPYLL